jgi:hypothetical protein
MEHLPSKSEALSSNPSTAQKKKPKEPHVSQAQCAVCTSVIPVCGRLRREGLRSRPVWAT